MTQRDIRCAAQTTRTNVRCVHRGDTSGTTRTIWQTDDSASHSWPTDRVAGAKTIRSLCPCAAGKWSSAAEVFGNGGRKTSENWIGKYVKHLQNWIVYNIKPNLIHICCRSSLSGLFLQTSRHAFTTETTQQKHGTTKLGWIAQLSDDNVKVCSMLPESPNIEQLSITEKITKNSSR